jgi:hypothetical protein
MDTVIIDGERISFTEIGLPKNCYFDIYGNDGIIEGRYFSSNRAIRNFLKERIDFYPVETHDTFYDDRGNHLAVPAVSQNRKAYNKYIWKMAKIIRTAWENYRQNKI